MRESAQQEEGREKKVVSVQYIVPLAASESPNPAYVLLPPPARLRRLRAARRLRAELVVWTGVKERRRRRGLLLLLLLVVVVGAQQQRQADNKIRQDVACRTRLGETAAHILVTL